jgi:hypothetical protein
MDTILDTIMPTPPPEMPPFWYEFTWSFHWMTATASDSERDSSDEQDAIHFRTRATLIEESPCYGEEWNSVTEALAKFMMARVRQLG